MICLMALHWGQNENNVVITDRDNGCGRIKNNRTPITPTRNKRVTIARGSGGGKRVRG